MGRIRFRRHQSPRFTQSEVEQMEKQFLDAKDESINQNFYEKLAEKINLASGRAGKRSIQWRQVQRWFQTKYKDHASKVTSTTIASNGSPLHSENFFPKNALESSSDTPKDIEEKVPQVLEYEARSARDGAWYDVATFMAHRILSSGEVEVLVRYEGFGAEEDEWANVKKAIRRRSIPLESYECQKLSVGDPILCFRESSYDASYFDAHVLEVQRKLHDIRGCRCVFLIRYDHDQTEERVNLKRLCRRPHEEEILHPFAQL